MVPYNTTNVATTTTYSACLYATSATTDDACNDYDDWIHLPRQIKEEKEVVIPQKVILFDRIVKMRNTDGRPIKYSTWKPVRMLCGRDNIGVRNFKKK